MMQPMYTMMNPFQQNYQNMQMQQMQMQQRQQDNMYAVGVPIVSSVAEVQRMITPPGSRTMFVDATQPLLYVRSVDNTGNNAEVNAFKIIPVEQSGNDNQNYVTVEQMQEALRTLEEKYAKHEPAVSESANATATTAADEPIVARHATPVNTTIIESNDAAASATNEHAGSIVASRGGQQPAAGSGLLH